jgi:hypothetical protein
VIRSVESFFERGLSQDFYSFFFFGGNFLSIVYNPTVQSKQLMQGKIGKTRE